MLSHLWGQHDLEGVVDTKRAAHHVHLTPVLAAVSHPHVLDLQVKSVAATELEAEAVVLPDQEAASADDASRLLPHDYELAQSVHSAR